MSQLLQRVKRELLDVIDSINQDKIHHDGDDFHELLRDIDIALAQLEQKPILRDIEQYRLQMAGISTAAIGYWKESDGILPDYDTVALRDVAKLYSKYDALYKARWSAQPEQEPVAWMCNAFDGKVCEQSNHDECENPIPLYTTPPALPEQEQSGFFSRAAMRAHSDCPDYATPPKEKNT